MFKPISAGRRTQSLIALGFLSFGITWLIAPDAMVRLFAAADVPLVPLALTALGTFAIAAGIFALFARFKSFTFVGFGVAMLPMFALDYWLHVMTYAFNDMILVHATGMAVMLAFCAHGFRVTLREERALERVAA